MPLQDANDSALDTSADASLDEDLDIRGEGVAGDEVNGAESSDAQDVTEGERSTLDVVQDVVKARDPEAASSAEGQKEGEDAKPEGDQTAKERDDENYTDVPFHKHHRFQQVLKEKKANQQDADRYRNIETFLSNSGVSNEEAGTALQIIALTKTNPVKAWEALKPMVQQLLIDAGEVLPQDLKARVESGELTVEAANEIARANAARTSAERARETDAQRQERAQQEARVQALRGAAVDWETQREAKDPNFAAKKPRIMKELAWIHATEGKADTPAKVREQLERAYKEAGAGAAPAPRRQVAAAPTVGQARQKPVSGGASQSQQPSKDEPIGALKHIQRIVAMRGAAAQ